MAPGKADPSADEQAQRQRYADEALATLRRAVELGYRDADRLKKDPDFELLRYAEHLLASGIGAASSRLVLSLLLRKRMSSRAALKLLDDASVAIHYNREILQTALDHVRQGIAVFDKDLHLVCWNAQFGEILDLPPHEVRVGANLAELLRGARLAEEHFSGAGL